jgi:heme oxygenase
MLSKQLAIDETYAMSFFNGYGEDTQLMWASFKQAIDPYKLTAEIERLREQALQLADITRAYQESQNCFRAVFE